MIDIFNWVYGYKKIKITLPTTNFLLGIKGG
jgi:hypothetical protein